MAFMKMLPLTVVDYLVIILSVAVTGFSAFAVYANPKIDASITIEGVGSSWFFPLNSEEMVTVSGPLGDTVVQMKGGQVRILSSPCVNQTCVSAGAISRHGQWLACLPNEVFVSIEGIVTQEQELDALSW
ncbi:MAG: NusG domain II-containing protein [Spirochaetaceae bacterium]|nr:NusG domain II-containing protein [Spirochaetaceae bacterium]